MSYDSVFTPPDVESANAEWGANCGPAALAAITGKTLAEIRPHLDGFATRRYMNPTHMYAALCALKWNFVPIGKNLPAKGLAFIQWGGFESLPMGVQYQHTHWIAVSRSFAGAEQIFEINACDTGGWVSSADWKKVMPILIKENKIGANGKWSVRTGIKVL